LRVEQQPFSASTTEKLVVLLYVEFDALASLLDVQIKFVLFASKKGNFEMRF